MGREEGLLPRGEGDFLWYRRWLREGDPRDLSRELERDRLRRSLEWECDRLRRSLEPERDLLRLLSLEWRWDRSLLRLLQRKTDQLVERLGLLYTSCVESESQNETSGDYVCGGVWRLEGKSSELIEQGRKN